MKYVGSERAITLSYEEHQTAEDYAGTMSSPISLKGTYKIIKTITKYKVHEDSINYRTFLENQEQWKKENGYQCTTITGKSLFVPSEELGGNCVILEGYYQDKLYKIGLYHLENVYVKEGDIIRGEVLLGTQGNTGLVLSSKDYSDKTYGTHVHVEVKNDQGNFINPRPFAAEENILTLDIKDTSLPQEEIIPIESSTPKEPSTPSEPNTSSKPDTSNEPVKEESKDTTSNHLTGEEDLQNLVYLYTCPKDDVYFVQLKKGEKLYLFKTSS